MCHFRTEWLLKSLSAWLLHACCVLPCSTGQQQQVEVLCSFVVAAAAAAAAAIFDKSNVGSATGLQQ
jgi:hypothetical protein